MKRPTWYPIRSNATLEQLQDMLPDAKAIDDENRQSYALIREEWDALVFKVTQFYDNSGQHRAIIEKIRKIKLPDPCTHPWEPAIRGLIKYETEWKSKIRKPDRDDYRTGEQNENIHVRIIKTSSE